MYCPGCGTQIDENLSYCPKCGKKIRETSVISEEPPVPKYVVVASEKKSNWKEILIIVLALALILAVIFSITAAISKMIFYDPHCYINYDELGRIKSFVDNRAGAVGITTTYKYSGNNTLPTSIVIEEDGGEGDQTTATITLFIEGDNVSRININTNGSYNTEFSYQYQTLF